MCVLTFLGQFYMKFICDISWLRSEFQWIGHLGLSIVLYSFIFPCFFFSFFFLLLNGCVQMYWWVFTSYVPQFSRLHHSRFVLYNCIHRCSDGLLCLALLHNHQVTFEISFYIVLNIICSIQFMRILARLPTFCRLMLLIIY